MKKFENGIIARGYEALRIWKRMTKDDSLYVAFANAPKVNPEQVYYIYVIDCDSSQYRGELVFDRLSKYV